MLVALSILTVLFAGVMLTLVTAQNTWSETNASIQLRENIRIVIEKIGREVKECGTDQSGALQLTVNNNNGVNGSDIVRFSIPVICQDSVSVMDLSGEVAY
ncbi:MAG: hypothetical protein HQL27_08605 [Candidatus Omnitrophica bacterium]|nr:hypothetical protein [Candidatus Omnitrophota bacterium]